MTSAMSFITCRIPQTGGRFVARKKFPVSKKPPLGAMPRFLWEESHPRPSAADLLARIDVLQAAGDRYKASGRKPFEYWADEVLQRFQELKALEHPTTPSASAPRF